MREEKYSYLMKSLFLLDSMYWKSINGEANYTAKDIKEVLKKDNVNFVYKHILFTQYFNKI